MSLEGQKGQIIFDIEHIDIYGKQKNSEDGKFLLQGEIFFVIGNPVAGMGMMDEIMIGPALDQKND